MIFSTIPTYPLNPNVTLDKYLYRHWTSKDGLPQNTITCFTEDKVGFLWIGTEHGLTQFDGNEFKIYTRKNTQAIKHNIITSLFVSIDGTLWIGTKGGGVTIFTKNNSRNFSTKNGLPSMRIRSISSDAQRKIRITSCEGETKSFILKNLNLIPVETKTITPQPRQIIPQIYRSEIFQAFSEKSINAIFEDKEEMFWVATDSGLFRYRRKRNKKPERVKEIEALQGNTSVTSLFMSHNGILWIGTYGKGMISLRDGGFNFYTTQDGLSNNSITSIYQENQQTFWIGTKGGGLNQLKNGKMNKITKDDGLCNNFITSIYKDIDGALWVGTVTGLNCIRSNHIYCYTQKDGLSDNSIKSLYRDREGTLWIGTDSGLTGYNNSGFFIPLGQINLKNHSIISIKEDNLYNIWLGTNKGLYFMQRDDTKFLLRNVTTTFSVNDIYIDNEGFIWIGTNGQGVFRYKKGMQKFLPYPIESDLSSACIYKIFEDENRYLWISSNQGFYVVPKDAYYWTKRRSRFRQSRPPEYYRFLESEGLKSPVFTGGIQPAGCQTKTGEIWFPTIEGVTVIKPTDLPLKKPILPIIIDKIITDGRTFTPKQTMVFPRGTRKIEFHFTSFNFRGVENLKYKCRLNSLFKGGNQEIITPQNVVVFNNILPAKYEFSINAGNEELGWSKPIKLKITVDYTLGGADVFIFILIIFLPILLVIISRLIDHKTKEKDMLKIFQDDTRYKTHFFERRKGKKYMLELLTIMEKEKPFLDPNMSVSKMAKRLGISKEHISQIINQQFYLNFNQFLNKYRIEEAKKRLKDPKENQFVVLKIAHDVGFNSKSTFNTAFKKFTGMSPSQFREKYVEKLST